MTQEIDWGLHGPGARTDRAVCCDPTCHAEALHAEILAGEFRAYSRWRIRGGPCVLGRKHELTELSVGFSTRQAECVIAAGGHRSIPVGVPGCRSLSSIHAVSADYSRHHRELSVGTVGHGLAAAIRCKNAPPALSQVSRRRRLIGVGVIGYREPSPGETVPQAVAQELPRRETSLGGTEELIDETGAALFPQLVWAHYQWERKLHSDGGPGPGPRACLSAEAVGVPGEGGAAGAGLLVHAQCLRRGDDGEGWKPPRLNGLGLRDETTSPASTARPTGPHGTLSASPTYCTNATSSRCGCLGSC